MLICNGILKKFRFFSFGVIWVNLGCDLCEKLCAILKYIVGLVKNLSTVNVNSST